MVVVVFHVISIAVTWLSFVLSYAYVFILIRRPRYHVMHSLSDSEAGIY